MQMFIAFQQDTTGKSKEVLTYISHCLNAEIREGSIGQQKGLVFVFKDDLRPFNFGGKRKYTVNDEDEVAGDIQSGKSLRQISRDRHIAPTTVHTLFDRYLARHPEAYQFLTRESFTVAKEYGSDETGLPEQSKSEQNTTHPLRAPTQALLEVPHPKTDETQFDHAESHPKTDRSTPEPAGSHSKTSAPKPEPDTTRPETAFHGT